MTTSEAFVAIKRLWASPARGAVDRRLRMNPAFRGKMDPSVIVASVLRALAKIEADDPTMDASPVRFRQRFYTVVDYKWNQYYDHHTAQKRDARRTTSLNGDQDGESAGFEPVDRGVDDPEVLVELARAERAIDRMLRELREALGDRWDEEALRKIHTIVNRNRRRRSPAEIASETGWSVGLVRGIIQCVESTLATIEADSDSLAEEFAEERDQPMMPRCG